MIKKILAVLLFCSVCLSLSGCIYWETSTSYELMHDVSHISCIRIYDTYTNDVSYDYRDPNEPCVDLIGEIPSDQISAFVDDLTGLSFVDQHFILLFPVTYDPNFYYGPYIVKVEYEDGSCELISECIQYKFYANEKYPYSYDYSVEWDAWLDFLQKYVDVTDITFD